MLNSAHVTCLRCLQKSAAQHLSRLSGAVGLERVYAEWQWWILAALPFPHLVRVLDCFFHEGIKVIYSFYVFYFVFTELRRSGCRIFFIIDNYLIFSSNLYTYTVIFPCRENFDIAILELVKMFYNVVYQLTTITK